MPASPSAERLYRHACREARIVLLVWLLSLLWCVGYCYLFGYRHAPDSWPVKVGLARAAEPPADGPAPLRTYLGFPDWVFFGILVPWVLCSLFTVAFAAWGMADDDLGQEQEEGPEHAA
jgi:hypothetical protein